MSKKKRNILIAVLVIALVAITAVFAGCADKNEGGEETTAGETAQVTEAGDTTEAASDTTAPEVVAPAGESSDKLYSEDGVDIVSVEADLVGEQKTLNLSVVFANNNAEEKEFDCSKFEIRAYSASGEEAVYKVSSSTKTFPANQPYIQWAFTVDDGGAIKEGDEVFVYYDGNAIDTVTVTVF